MQSITSEWPILKMVAGIAGALVSLRWIEGVSLFQKCLMVLGGGVLSYVATDTAVEYLKMPNASGFLAFLIGLFGMSVMNKAFETLAALNASDIAATINKRLRGRAE